MDGYQMIPTWYHRGQKKNSKCFFLPILGKFYHELKTQTDQEGQEGESKCVNKTLGKDYQ
jgi:hypothetical protein